MRSRRPIAAPRCGNAVKIHEPAPLSSSTSVGSRGNAFTGDTFTVFIVTSAWKSVDIDAPRNLWLLTRPAFHIVRALLHSAPWPSHARRVAVRRDQRSVMIGPYRQPFAGRLSVPTVATV